jgi:hypothetical protein
VRNSARGSPASCTTSLPNVSVMVIQAGVERHALPDERTATDEAFGSVEQPGARSWSRRDDPEAVAARGVAYASVRCAELLAGGAPGLHL